MVTCRTVREISRPLPVLVRGELCGIQEVDRKVEVGGWENNSVRGKRNNANNLVRY